MVDRTLQVQTSSQTVSDNILTQFGFNNEISPYYIIINLTLNSWYFKMNIPFKGPEHVVRVCGLSEVTLPSRPESRVFARQALLISSFPVILNITKLLLGNLYKYMKLNLWQMLRQKF